MQVGERFGTFFLPFDGGCWKKTIDGTMNENQFGPKRTPSVERCFSICTLLLRSEKSAIQRHTD